MMNATMLLWVYVALLVAGGLMGFFKAKSAASLITSTIFAVLIALSALGILELSFAMIWIGLLAVFFGVRFSKTKKLMPAGLMMMVSAATLVLLFIVSR